MMYLETFDQKSQEGSFHLHVIYNKKVMIFDWSLPYALGMVFMTMDFNRK